MNKFQMPMQQPPFQLLSSGYVVLSDIMRFIPPNISANMPIDAIQGFIPSSVYTNGWHYTVIFEAGCGCYLTTAIGDKQFARPVGRSWTGQMMCKYHRKTCKSCGVTLCISGRPDGFVFDPQDGQKPYYLCTPHFEEQSKDLKKSQFWSGFWKGLLGDKT